MCFRYDSAPNTQSNLFPMSNIDERLSLRHEPLQNLLEPEHIKIKTNSCGPIHESNLA